MNRVDKTKSGFTIVELMLAMGFVSALLLAIAMTVIQIGNIYNRGITYKDVNQAGGALASELRKGISGSSPFKVVPGVDTRYIITGDWGGRLCLGQYSYIWNYGKAIQVGDNSRLNVYSNSSDQIRFVKAFDPSASYCTQQPYKKIDSSNAVELLDSGQHNLAIHSFSVTTDPTANDNGTGQRLYSIEFLIGTNDQTSLNAGNTACLLPTDPKSDPSYCSVNKFYVVARAGNVVE